MCSAADYSYLTAVDAQQVASKPQSVGIMMNYPMFLTTTFPKPTTDISSEADVKHLTDTKPYLTNLQTLPVKPTTAPENSQQSYGKERDTADSKNQDNSKLRPYTCDECGKSFLLKHHLTTHVRTHTGVKPHCCMYCGKSFTHKHCLNTHLLLHSSERPFQCVECKKSFTLKHHLLTHMKVHSRDTPFLCGECGRSFPSKRHLVTHCKFHAGERPYICEECGESFAQKDHLVMHSRFHGFLDSFVCGDCGASFTRKFELVNHEKLHGKTPYTCPVCNKEFLQKRTMVAHVRNHSEDFTCFHCGETFSNRNDLMQHNKTHTNTQTSNLLVCQECGSSFNTPEALAIHIKLHTGDTSLVNDICNLTANLHNPNLHFNINSFGFNHQNTSSNPTNAATKRKNHLCQHCSKTFSTKQGFQQHQRRHPNGTCSVRSHVCNVCNKGFFQKNHLMLHQRQHMDNTRVQSNSVQEEEVNVTDFLKVKLDSESDKNAQRKGQMDKMHLEVKDGASNGLLLNYSENNVRSEIGDSSNGEFKNNNS